MAQCDPMAKIPLEVAIHIFSHLPVADTWRLRSVSKSWNVMLSASEAQNASLSRYVDIPTNDDNVSDHLRVLKARCTGEPFAYSTLDLPNSDKLYSVILYHTAFAGTQFVYLSDAETSREPHTINIIDVRTGDHRSWRIPQAPGYPQNYDAHSVSKVFLTPKIVGYWSQGIVHIVDLTSPPGQHNPISFRVGLDGFPAISANDSKLAVFFRAPPEEAPTIWFYDHTTRKSKYLLAEHNAPRDVFSVHAVQLTDSSIITFFVVQRSALYSKKTGKFFLLVTSYKLDGETEWEVKLDYLLEPPAVGLRTPFNYNTMVLRKTGVEDRYHLSVYHSEWRQHDILVDVNAKQASVLSAEDSGSVFWRDSMYRRSFVLNMTHYHACSSGHYIRTGCLCDTQLASQHLDPRFGMSASDHHLISLDIGQDRSETTRLHVFSFEDKPAGAAHAISSATFGSIYGYLNSIPWVWSKNVIADKIIMPTKEVLRSEVSPVAIGTMQSYDQAAELASIAEESRSDDDEEDDADFDVMNMEASMRRLLKGVFASEH